MWRVAVLLALFTAAVPAWAADDALSLDANKAFLAANAKAPGVIVRPDGLEFKILQNGFGRRPGLTDSVQVYYTGVLINGTVFDGTSPGLPATFKVNSVIPGWVEALTLMREGDHWQVVIPANIAYGDTHPDPARVAAAVKAAHLTEVIDGLQQGLDTLIGDNGNRLSGGQRQRLAIARAIYKDAPILILDEATSALDTESERAVQGALDDLMRDRTTLVIAHRLSTIERASRIVVLVHGEIVEIGTHAELLAKNGAYANLYHLQFEKEAA